MREVSRQHKASLSPAYSFISRRHTYFQAIPYRFWPLSYMTLLRRHYHFDVADAGRLMFTFSS